MDSNVQEGNFSEWENKLRYHHWIFVGKPALGPWPVLWPHFPARFVSKCLMTTSPFILLILGHFLYGKIAEPKLPMNRFPAWRAATTTLFDVPARQATYYIGWRNRILRNDSWASQTFTNPGSGGCPVKKDHLLDILSWDWLPFSVNGALSNQNDVQPANIIQHYKI